MSTHVNTMSALLLQVFPHLHLLLQHHCYRHHHLLFQGAIYCKPHLHLHGGNSHQQVRHLCWAHRCLHRHHQHLASQPWQPSNKLFWTFRIKSCRSSSRKWPCWLRVPGWVTWRAPECPWWWIETANSAQPPVVWKMPPAASAVHRAQELFQTAA